MVSRVLSLVVLTIVGLAFGALGTVMHSATVSIAGVNVTWGIVVALAAVGCLLVGLRVAASNRLAAAFASLGVLVAVGVLSQPSFGGSVLVVNGTIGWVWMGGCVVIALVVVAWPRLPQRPESQASQSVTRQSESRPSS